MSSVRSSQGFAELNDNCSRDLGAVELGFGIANRKTTKNFHGCTVVEGARLSTKTIGSALGKF